MKTTRRMKSNFGHDFKHFLYSTFHAISQSASHGRKPVTVLFIFTFALIITVQPVLFPDTNPSALAKVASINLQQQASSHEIYLPVACSGPTTTTSSEGWPMVGANPQRTSWTSDEVTGNLHVEWYRPIEAYIPHHAQIIASNGLIFVPTAKGLYALNPRNGELAWRFDTEMPLGNSPTVAEDVVYVGGYDNKIHALDVHTGQHLWEFAGAKAGFDTNPLVVEGKVIAGNRDGYIYAIGAHRTAQAGELIWRYKTGGPIHFSAAYQDGKLYFASNDNYAYALRAFNGDLVWKSDKLPGDGFHSYWPVVYGDKVVFSGSVVYRMGMEPGMASVKNASGDGYTKFTDMDQEALWPNDPYGALIGNNVPGQTWSNGFPVLDASRITEYYEDNPATELYKHKPWRRIVVVLNSNNGSEYTFDSDGDGYDETIPIMMWGTHSGNFYPPIAGPDNLLYFANIYENFAIPQGRIMGWSPSTPSYLSILHGQGAVDEPFSMAAGGDIIYYTNAGGQVANWFSVSEPNRRGRIWDYGSPLTDQAPGYDQMYWFLPGTDFYTVYGTTNGIYGDGSVQPTIIPYQGRLFVHRRNAIVAFGPGPSIGQVPLLTANEVDENLTTPSVEELKSRLEDEIQKILDAGHLRPGSMNPGMFNACCRELIDYFENPGDTLYTLAKAYPHMPADIQSQLRGYLQREFRDYFDPVMYSTTGWADGVNRESMPVPPEVEDSFASYPPQERAGPRWSWSYPQHNFNAMKLYAELFPAERARVYELAKSRLQVPVPSTATTDHFIAKPWELNAYIAGYYGFLDLQQAAGMSGTDSQLRLQVSTELNRLLALRNTIFDKDTPWTDMSYVIRRHLNIARNFIMLSPELGDYMNSNMLAEVREAIAEYEDVAPYWFVSRFEVVHDEGVISNLYNNHALLQAKAYILKESRSELAKYLDVPSFERGDLFYIQNLITVIEAQP
jgi:hypothetical protein